MPSGYATDIPTANDFVQPPGNIARILPSPPDWQGIGEVPGNVVGCVEVGIATALSRMHRIADEAIASKCYPVSNQGNVVDGMGPGVIEVELQVVGQILLQGHQQSVIAGETLVGVHGVFCKLSGHANVVVE